MKNYEEASKDYDEYRLPWIKGPLIFLECEILRRLVKDCPILEVGCGTGRIASYFTDNQEYFGIDISRSMICRAKSKCGHKLHLILSDAEMMCFRKETFRSLLALKVFKFLNPSEFLKEAKRVLKNNGMLLLVVQVRDSAALRLLQRLGLFVSKDEKHYYTWEVISMLKEAGFKPLITMPVANVALGLYLFTWYLFYPIPLARRIMQLLITNSSLIKLIVNLDKIIRSKWLVLVIGLR
jgi:SAM-dependent methyltransferase